MPIPREEYERKSEKEREKLEGGSNGITIYEPKEIECRKSETKRYIKKKRELEK